MCIGFSTEIRSVQNGGDIVSPDLDGSCCSSSLTAVRELIRVSSATGDPHEWIGSSLETLTDVSRRINFNIKAESEAMIRNSGTCRWRDMESSTYTLAALIRWSLTKCKQSQRYYDHGLNPVGSCNRFLGTNLGLITHWSKFCLI